MIAKIKKYLWKTDEMEFDDAPANSIGKFKIVYNSFVIGFLDYDGKVWTFCYSNEFKQSNKLSTISDFPDASKIYENNSLWPFFAARIPALNQPYQLKKIERLKIDKKDSIELLKLFGKRTIANPFLLIAV